MVRTAVRKSQLYTGCVAATGSSILARMPHPSTRGTAPPSIACWIGNARPFHNSYCDAFAGTPRSEPAMRRFICIFTARLVCLGWLR
jgi:hypothetical protein